MNTLISDYQANFSKQSDNLMAYFGKDGFPNRAFMYKLLLEDGDSFLKFLMDSSLIPSEMKCENCYSDMRIIKKNSFKLDGLSWFCGSSVGVKRCGKVKSIRHGSFFSGSSLKMGTIFLLCYEFFLGSSVDSINADLNIFTQAISSWRRKCTDVLIYYIKNNTEKIGGPGKVVEVYEFQIGNQKFNRSDFVNDQWVFGGVERETGRCFIVSVPDRRAKALVNIIKEWIEPETLVVLDYWKEYNALGEEAYDYLTEEHSIHFKDPATGSHADAESSWIYSSVKDAHRRGDFKIWIMFWKLCNSQNVSPFVKFFCIVQSINWAEWLGVSSETE